LSKAVFTDGDFVMEMESIFFEIETGFLKTFIQRYLWNRASGIKSGTYRPVLFLTLLF
jgi:hypothetical protein